MGALGCCPLLVLGSGLVGQGLQLNSAVLIYASMHQG